MMYFAYVYPFITYCLSIWGGAANVHVNKVMVLQKAAIRILLGLSMRAHVQSSPDVLLFHELYTISLALFVFRNFACKCNLGLFENEGYVLLSNMRLNRKGTRGESSCNYFLPYVRTSLRKSSVVHKSVIVWNSLPGVIRTIHSVSLFRSQLHEHVLCNCNQ